MKSFRLLPLVMCLTAILTVAGCQQPVEDPYILISGEAVLKIPQEKATLQVLVKTNREWALRMDKKSTEWMTVEPATGGPSSEHAIPVTLTVAENMGANRTAAIEFYTGTATAMLTVVQEGPDGESDGIEAKSVAEFIALADPYTYYRLTGTVSGFNASYCSFDLTDETGTVYVYSVAESSKPAWKDKIKNEGTITLRGLYKFYNSKHEVVEAEIESFTEAPEPEYTVATAAQIIEGAAAGDFQMEGATVVCIPSVNTLVVSDGTAMLYVYKSKHGLSVGDVLTIKGAVVMYEDQVVEFNDPKIEKTGKGEVPAPVAVAWSGEDIDAYCTAVPVTVQYVTVVGLLIKDGNYINLTPTGTTTCEKVSLYIGDADLSALVGKPVRVTGYAFTASAKNKNVSIAMISIAEDTGASYVTVNPTSLTWKAGETTAKTVAVTASGTEITVEPDAGAFSPAIWATATVSGNVVTITPDSVNESDTDARTGAFIVSCDGVTTTITVTQKKVEAEYDFTSNVTWALGTNAYDHTSGTETMNPQTAVVNDVTVDKVVKLGTSKNPGDFTVTVPAGTKKVGFFALAWKGVPAKITLTCGGKSQTYDLAANDGVASNPPYTITTTAAEAYFEFELPDTDQISIKFTSEKRAVIWGINAYTE